MQSFNRRTLLSGAGAFATARALHASALIRSVAAQNNENVAEDNRVNTLHLSASWNEAIFEFPKDMLGLSYESAQLGAPDFFSAENTELIALVRELAPQGVLRLGGNLSEFTYWDPENNSIPRGIPFQAAAPDASAKKLKQRIPITREAVTRLRGFLDATGWQAIYGLNLAHADRARVVEEARFVALTLGSRLKAFQIGNEPNHYVMNGLRPAGYSFDDYFSEWIRLHHAVLGAVPSAHFAGPDVAEGKDWIQRFATVAPNSVIMLTGHHYVAGPPTDASVTAERLLTPDASFETTVQEIEVIAEKHGRPFVMAETNTCFNAGKQGVSDVYAAALWSVDYFLRLARAKERGVYFHGGGDGWYTPISGGSGRPFTPRPIYFGLRLCRRFLGRHMVEIEWKKQRDGVSAYALQNPRQYVVINRLMESVRVGLPANELATYVQRLTAPSLLARTGIVLSPGTPSREEQSRITVPAYSVAIITV